MSNDKNDQVKTTGHVWDEDLEEYNNPLPRWWVWVFYLTIIWGIGYTIAYPAWPLVEKATPGLLGFSTRANVQAEIERFAEMNAEVRAELAAADLTTLADNEEVYNFAIQSGEATFNTWCVQCHQREGGGAPNYPVLSDNAWLWGGDIEEIAYTIRHGVRNEDDPDARWSEMPAFGDDYLSDQEIDQVVNYVMSLSPVTKDAADTALAAEGETVFMDNCSACHMEDGTGDRFQGAPNLTDAIWLYGSDYDSIRNSVETGPFGVMPAWGPRLDDAEINGVAAYVHQLGGGE